MHRLPLSHVLILWLAGVVCVLATTAKPILNQHEVFAAEPAREMLAGGSLVLQPFAGQYRTKKPPGQSWLIAAALGVTRHRNEWTARLPSALAGVGLAWVVAVLANKPGRPWRGLIAGLMTLTTVGIQQYVRLAEADMALTLAVTGANAAVLRALAGDVPPRRRWAVGFWGGIVAGVLLKGPVVLVFTLLPALLTWGMLRFSIKDRTAATAVARVAFWWPAVAGGVLAMFAWPVAAYVVYPPVLAQWKYELLDRSRGTIEQGGRLRHDPLLTYVYALPYGLLPWCVFLFPAAVWAWRNRVWRRPATLFCVCWAAAGFVVLSAVAFKTLHYALPIMPPFVLGAAVGFDAVLAWWLRGRPVRRRVPLRRAALAGWFGVAVVGFAVNGAFVAPQRDRYPGLMPLAKTVDRTVPRGQTLYLYRLLEEQTVWYLNVPVRQTTALPPKPSYVLCWSDDVPALEAAGRVTVLFKADAYLGREEVAGNRRWFVRYEDAPVATTRP